MVVIDTYGLVGKIEEYNNDTNRSKSWFEQLDGLASDDDSVDSKFNIVYEEPWEFNGKEVVLRKRRGISFGYTAKLVMQLIERAYNHLTEDVDIKDYAIGVANAMARFAHPFPSDQQTMCYPHFLLHGIAQPTLEGVVDKIDSNARIISETLEARERIASDYGHRRVNGSLHLRMANGLVDDYFGITHILSNGGTAVCHTGFLAQAGFFVDKTNQDLYVLSLQGGRFRTKGDTPEAEQDTKDRKRQYNRIQNGLGMSPRRFILSDLQDLGRELGHKRIRVVRPEEHPMAIESHDGFFGNYEPVIRKAGITTKNGPYLERKL